MYPSTDQKQAVEAIAARQSAPPAQQYIPLDQEARSAVDTTVAAFHLNRRPQTLRVWASHGTGPVRPIRVHGRLAWRVDDLKRVLGVA